MTGHAIGVHMTGHAVGVHMTGHVVGVHMTGHAVGVHRQLLYTHQYNQSCFITSTHIHIIGSTLSSLIRVNAAQNNF